MITKS